MFAAADGVIYQSSKNASDLGKWRIAPEGQFCRAWWERPQERCYVVYQEGESLELYPTDRWGKVLVRRAHGQSGGLLKTSELSICAKTATDRSDRKLTTTPLV